MRLGRSRVWPIISPADAPTGSNAEVPLLINLLVELENMARPMHSVCTCTHQPARSDDAGIDAVETIELELERTSHTCLALSAQQYTCSLPLRKWHKP
jgi:hypothetical protein